jgi:hypothetical protein
MKTISIPVDEAVGEKVERLEGQGIPPGGMKQDLDLNL